MSDCTIPILDISIFCNEKSPPTIDDPRELCYAWDEAMQKVFNTHLNFVKIYMTIPLRLFITCSLELVPLLVMEFQSTF